MFKIFNRKKKKFEDNTECNTNTIAELLEKKIRLVKETTLVFEDKNNYQQKNKNDISDIHPPGFTTQTYVLGYSNIMLGYGDNTNSPIYTGKTKEIFHVEVVHIYTDKREYIQSYFKTENEQAAEEIFNYLVKNDGKGKPSIIIKEFLIK